MYKNCAVLITGHTGFKGSWLAPLLAKLGSKLCGYSLDIPSSPSHFLLQKIPIQDVRGDVTDFDQLRKTMQQFKPEIVFHLAAQSLVRLSFQKPAETFAANVTGTVNVLEACRQTPSVRAVLIITSDKCYKNNTEQQSFTPHMETDPLGGGDPYSASKACAEIVTESYRHAFGSGHFLMASCRSGNVIGGGDWAKDRLVPDLIRSAAGGPPAILRMPDAVRPWQHVLNPISGYLRLGAKLLEGKKEFAEAWNFGPDAQESRNENLPVKQIAQLLKRHWNKVHWKTEPENGKETAVLMLDSGKARQRLGWKPVWSFSEALEKTAEWYRRFYENGTIQTDEQIEQFGDYFLTSDRIIPAAPM
ncbi:MAG: CDP-glucose 4,6-dehydratase [Planctomycetaceae bacterium]|jgi:CDP-glucose 4,6-dehydratase|nr:CDP-glucose 4,6-dehydratase [Planctomycetaceae bacterium]